MGWGTEFFSLGFTHVIPYGYDHLLFIICLFFARNKFYDLSLLSLCFTLAHSITLAAGYFKIMIIPPPVTEPLIALSILIMASLRIIGQQKIQFPYVTVFIFGLLHGSGFAGTLSELLDKNDSWVTPLLMFNLGIEAAQFSVLTGMFLLFNKLLIKNESGTEKLIRVISSLCAAAGMYLFVSRITDSLTPP